MKSYTDKQVKQMLSKAFNKGEQWGTTYQGWFSPTRDEKDERRKQDCNKILETFKGVVLSE